MNDFMKSQTNNRNNLQPPTFNSHTQTSIVTKKSRFISILIIESLFICGKLSK